MSMEAFDARLQGMNAVLASFVRPLAAWLAFFTLFRFLCWFTGDLSLQSLPWTELLAVFGTGIRFDLLVIGFVLIPAVLFGMTAAFGAPGFPRVTRAWLVLAWILMSFCCWASWGFFIEHGRHLTRFDLGPELSLMPAGLTGALGSLIYLALGFQGARLVWSAEAKPGSARRENVMWRALRISGPVVLVALMARGTVTAHHLEKQHSEISQDSRVNQLVLNPVWFFDKNPSDFE